MTLLLLLTLSCRPAATTDSDTDSGSDSAVSTVPEGTVAASLTAGPEVVCADPAARMEGPMVELQGGYWDRQLWPLTSGSPGRGAAVADLDGDGHLDVYLPNLQAQDQLYLGDGTGQLHLAPAGAFPDHEFRTYSTSAADFDDDGDLDLLAVMRFSPNMLYVNDGTGVFTGAEDLGLAVEVGGSTGSAWGDLDGDGDLDLVVHSHRSADVDPGTFDPNQPGTGDPSELYLNQGDGTFSDASDLLPQQAHDGFTYMVGLQDLDLDGRLDLYFVNDFGGLGDPPAPTNRALHNDSDAGSLALSDMSDDASLGVTIFGMGLGVADINGDRHPDMLIMGWDDVALLESEGAARYHESDQARGLTPEVGVRDVGWASEFADLDNDGVLDVVMAFGWLQEEHESLQNPESQPNALYRGLSDGSYVQEAEAWGVDDPGQSRGIVPADLNEDGFLDLLVRNLDGPARLFLSRCDDAAWLRLQLAQPAPNRNAVGARVEVVIDGVRQVRWVTAGGTGFASGGPPEVHFGLGDADRIDHVTVFWPDGETSVLLDVQTRRLATVTRD